MKTPRTPDTRAALKSAPSPFHSLGDFLASVPLTVDGLLNDGWGERFAVKGYDLDAAILFMDMSSFSSRTSTLTPCETLAFVNHFVAWITAEALKNRPGIVDKYIGDELMIVFAREFGSVDPVQDAIHAARDAGNYDAWNFDPHFGIAAGPVIVGQIGTSKMYSYSVFGPAVALAARCAATKRRGSGQCSIILPAALWGSKSLEAEFPGELLKGSDGSERRAPCKWEFQGPRTERPKNMGEVEVVEISRISTWCPGITPEERAKHSTTWLKEAGFYCGPPSVE